MQTFMKCLFAIAACLLVAQPVMADDATGRLVTSAWLQKNLSDPNLLILDASPTPAHAAQHIPGAVNIDLLTYGVHELPLADMEERFQKWGLSPGKKVVIYDQGAGMLATRLFFDLYYHGFPEKNLYVLDGGLNKWQAEDLPVTKEPTPAPKRGTFKVSKLREDMRVRLPEVLNASGEPEKHKLIEALDPNWHFGELVVFGQGGHIPNGIMVPSRDFYNADKTFKSPAEIKKMMDYLGVRPDQPVYTYCGGGVAATVPLFALKFMLGYPNVKLYKESLMGWMQDQRGLPHWTYDAPYMMRDANWLRHWGGTMMRRYGASQLSVVDVRSPGAFQEGHVPFALNVPADVFRNHLHDPAKLAQVLGPAGVNPAHEAVIVSGAGLTKEAALAYLMLETIGQRKVSVLVDPAERWQPSGLTPTREATVVAAKKNFQDLSIPPVQFTAQVRPGTLIRDAAATQGLYPKVFIASGSTLPANAPAGKVVHVPHTELLNPDGTPKPAKDIWNILTKAGVPRYAELVLIGDDPGEAAVNYYILRLMGYPDVKVLI